MDTLQAQLETLKQLAEKNLIDKDEYTRCKDNILKNWLSNQTSNSSHAPSQLKVLINEKKDKNAAASPEKENKEPEKASKRKILLKMPKGESFIKDRVAQLMITPEYQKVGKLAAFTKHQKSGAKFVKS